MTTELIDGFLAALPMPAVLVDQTERFIAVNNAAEALLGQGIQGRHFATILRQPSVAAAIEACLHDRESRSARHLSNDGAQDTTFSVTLRYVPGIGAVAGGAVLACFEDITEREQAGQMRRDFVGNVSHELRTPLTALIGFIETLRGPAKEDAAARDRFLTIMEGEASRMNRLVGDLLSLNRVESEERVRPREKVDLTGHLASTLKTLTPVAEARGTTMVLEAPDEPVFVTGDPDQLQQVFTNLVENAVKYGGDQVRVVLTYTERDPAVRAPAARVQVIDNGPGIDAIHLPRLTERFYRADSHRSREMGGTGLGLAIVKHIVNRHRGRLRVESELGQGAVFTVILPE
ncbi:two-component sensor histidine kinase [Leisingera daeponensis]|uniref:histidine kinase n=1 Tax=Leisingera daeponensis TaxID=405746 RepID=A0ABS7NC35_9RHOB|nr:ATP-binding protein [Leisingera daeponensis]MBY6055317.1 two-component sensor histidine kinase [Leisingera daeponensis]MBY6138309.1 two-component sensor histidine kinase [Leisingera daeponensis]